MKDGGWSHDYPDAEEHFMRIMREVTSLNPFIASRPMLGGVIVALDDPTKRLMAIANYVNGIDESWQWSGQGWFPVTESNDACKPGVNYLIYALTH